jgi:hypothetical protein
LESKLARFEQVILPHLDVEHGCYVMRTILLKPGVTGVANNREQPGATIYAAESVKKLKST